MCDGDVDVPSESVTAAAADVCSIGEHEHQQGGQSAVAADGRSSSLVVPPASIKTEGIDTSQAATVIPPPTPEAVVALAAAYLEDEGSLQPALSREEEDSEATQVGGGLSVRMLEARGNCPLWLGGRCVLHGDTGCCPVILLVGGWEGGVCCMEIAAAAQSAY